MAYIGSSAAVTPVAFSGVNAQSFNGDGSTVAFTLNRPVSSVAAIEVVVNNVQQSPYDGSYSVSNTTLTFSAAPSTGTGNIYVVYRDFPVGSITDPNTYTKTQTDALIAGRVAKTGDTMTGALNVPDVVLSNGTVSARLLPATADNRAYLVTTSAHGLSLGSNNIWDRLNIDSAGRVTMPYQPAFRAGHLTTATPSGMCVFPDVFVNVGSCYNNTNGRFTAPVTGVYHFDVGLLKESNAGAGNAHLYVNGAQIAQTEMYSNDGFTGYKRLVGSFVLSLNASDYVQVYTQQTIHLGGNHNNFSGHLIG